MDALVTAPHIITYCIDTPVSVSQFVKLLKRTSLGERSPLDDISCVAGMLEEADITVTAWDGERLVGISRALTDFHFACYLSDLAVDEAYQHAGIGKELQRLTRSRLGPRCQMILLAAPAAKDYYGKIGYSHNERCWVLEPGQELL